MQKPIWKSKTLWGFGIAALIWIGNLLGVGITDDNIATIIQIIGGFWGVYGLRTAIK